nr:hypothetical protein [Tanacetum cinerariifolium]
MTLADKATLSGADNRPPMLEKNMYDSWKSIMELYMMNRQHGRMILESVQNGPLIWPMIEENSVTMPRKYSELTLAEAIQADCDVKETNIILQGLPPKVYALLYMMNRQHGRMILESVQNGPLIWPMIEENSVTMPRKYSELTLAEAIQADCDVKETNIILQGLPPKVYALVMSSSEQSSVVSHSETKITSDRNIIPYSQYVDETQQAAVTNSNASAQQDALILSVIEQLKTQVVEVMVEMVVLEFHECDQERSRRNIRDVVKKRVQMTRKMDLVFDGAFGGVRDEEVVVGEGLNEEALVEFMVEWCEEDDDDDDRNKEDDLFN